MATTGGLKGSTYRRIAVILWLMTVCGVRGFKYTKYMHVTNACYSIGQDTLNQAIDQLRRRLVIIIKAKGAHVDFSQD